MSFFGLGRSKCKQMIKYDGTSLDLSGLNISGIVGAGPLNIGLGALKIKHELVQAAAEIAQLIDGVQYANCIKIEQTLEGSPERMKVINQAMESERQLIQFAFVMKMVSANPSSESIQKALAEWIASQSTRIPDLSAQAQNIPITRGEKPPEIPNRQQIESSIEAAKRVEPELRHAMKRGASFDLNNILNKA